MIFVGECMKYFPEGIALTNFNSLEKSIIITATPDTGIFIILRSNEKVQGIGYKV
jgi:hypothetical protein